ncbi:MAG: FO synthase [Desulfosporosinus sp.]
MSSLFAQSELFDLIEKVEKGERINRDAGVRMMNSKDILALGYMANIVRERKNGNLTYYMVNGQYNYTNVHDAIMLYGNIKSAEERIDRILHFRALQDQTNEFLSFTPLFDYPKDAKLEPMGTETTGLEDLKMLAISRILLDNYDHIKALWIMVGLKLTQVSLAFGVDYLEGKVVEQINDSGGSETSREMTKRAMIQMINKAGRDAVECKS